MDRRITTVAIRVLFAVAIICAFNEMTAQAYATSSTHRLTLRNKQEVQVVQNPMSDDPHAYYYLPTGLRLSYGKGGSPEFNFTSYETDGVAGAIMHFLLVWGLEPKQELELQQLLRESVDSLAILRGAAMVSTPIGEKSMQIRGDENIRVIFENCVGGMPATAISPGTKMAMAYRLKGDEVHVVQRALQSGEGLEKVYIEMTFEYTTRYTSGLLNRTSQLQRYLLSTSMHEIFEAVTK